MSMVIGDHYTLIEAQMFYNYWNMFIILFYFFLIIVIFADVYNKKNCKDIYRDPNIQKEVLIFSRYLDSLSQVVIIVMLIDCQLINNLCGKT